MGADNLFGPACVTRQFYLEKYCLPPIEVRSRKFDRKIARPLFYTRLENLTQRVIHYRCRNGNRTKKVLRLATWNVRTLMDTTNNNKPEQTTALVAAELGRYDIDIAVLAEMKLVNEGSLVLVAQGHTFFWKGLTAEERQIHGIGFGIRNNIMNQLSEVPTKHSERLISLSMS